MTRRGGWVGDLLWSLAYAVVAGVAAGVAWWRIATPAYFVRTAQGEAMLQGQLGQRVQADGVFFLVSVVVAAAGGLLLTRLRDRDPVRTVVLGALASLLAGVLALVVGGTLGHSDVRALGEAAKVGTRIPDSLRVISHLVLLAWPIGYLLAALLVLWGTKAPDIPNPGEPSVPDAANR